MLRITIELHDGGAAWDEDPEYELNRVLDAVRGAVIARTDHRLARDINGNAIAEIRLEET